MDRPTNNPTAAACRCFRLRLLVAGAALFASADVRAQTAPVASAPNRPAASGATDETIVLNPFTVSTDKDVGYEASESLAGTGLKTKLTDLGASVSVITARFFEDTGAKT